MERTIIRAKTKQIKLNIPEEYIGKEIEITYLSLEELYHKSQRPVKKMEDFWGVISDDTATKLHAHVIKSRGEWERNI